MRAVLAFIRVHRLEFLVALAIPLGLALFGLITVWRLDGIGASPYCITDWLIDGPTRRPECTSLMQRWGEIATSGGVQPFFLAMAIAPIGVGLLAGVPIVARELEGGSAAFSWWLHPSRTKWLSLQGAALGVPLLLTVAVAAFAADPVAARDHAWGLPAFDRIGLHGPDAIARAAAAFGLGVLVGSVSGRTLLGFVAAALLVVAVVFGINLARDTWIAGLEPTIIGIPDPVSGELVVQPRAVFSGWGMQGDTHVMMGVSEASAMGWEPIEAGLYLSVALMAVAGSIAVVRTKRPR
jgi:hypothetical protein